MAARLKRGRCTGDHDPGRLPSSASAALDRFSGRSRIDQHARWFAQFQTGDPRPTISCSCAITRPTSGEDHAASRSLHRYNPIIEVEGDAA